MKKKNYKQNKNQKKDKKDIYDDIIVLKKEDPKKKKRSIIKKENQKPLKKIEYPSFTCTKCGLPINELSSAIADKETNQPVHFKCVIEFLKKAEELKEKEDLIYIGNGNFAIVYFENPKNRKKFKIIKLIEWENKNITYQWKSEIANLASKV